MSDTLPVAAPRGFFFFLNCDFEKHFFSTFRKEIKLSKMSAVAEERLNYSSIICSLTELLNFFGWFSEAVHPDPGKGGNNTAF